MVRLQALLWLLGSAWRVVRLARFFQLEEYKPDRYLLWLRGQRRRIVIARALGAVGFALGISLIMPDLAPFAWGAAAVAGTWPIPEGEVKKDFVLTLRAARILGVSIVLIALPFLLITVFPQDVTGLIMAGVLGLIVFHLTPLALPAAVIVLAPFERLIKALIVWDAAGILRRAQPNVIGITGSYGKTSTKNFITHLLGGRYRVLQTPKSYNTLMGVCIVIRRDLRVSQTPEYTVDHFVVEMGAYVEGEIREICDLTHPDMAVITAVGPQHLERFGSLEATARAKYELVAALPSGGVGFFNWDNAYVRGMMAKRDDIEKITVSADPDAPPLSEGGPQVIASDLGVSADGLTFTITDRRTGDLRPFTTSLLGRHNVTNILLAAAVALHEDIPLGEIALRVASLEPVEHRLQLRPQPNGTIILDDAYSANPVGAAEAVRTLGLFEGGRRVLITPGMVELGPIQWEENAKLGEIAAAHCTDAVLVGTEQAEPIREGLRRAGFPAENIHVVPTRAEAFAWYNTRAESGDAVLFLNDLVDTYL